jgi:hypothetical protein
LVLNGVGRLILWRMNQKRLQQKTGKCFKINKMKKKPLILVTNDDGITAPGIRSLIATMSEIGDVIVVAPDKPQSATGHAITINNTLYLNQISANDATIIEHSCSGTPVDCVKFAVNEIMKQKDAYEDETFIYQHSKIWERDQSNYKHNYCNLIINNEIFKQES